MSGLDSAEGRLSRIEDVATELGADTLAADARQERQRLCEARFFVACVGQFKRGKSTLLNALVGQAVLPVGVVPVTSVITILRYGERPSAIVRFRTGRSESVALQDVGTFVDERQNPENRRGAAVVEVFLPSPLLSAGLCLVDTPGLGSVHPANTAATRAFVPQIDVAVIVVGPDPPISGAELDLIDEVAREAGHLLVVLNKADLASAEGRREVVVFTRHTLQQRLGRPVDPIFEVSALEWIEQQQPTRDWTMLEDQLKRLAGDARQRLVAAAAIRAVRRLGRRALAEITLQDAALCRPLLETEARVTRLRAAFAEMDRALRDLRFLFDATEAELVRMFEQQRIAFLRDTGPELQRALGVWIAGKSARLARGSLRAEALAEARRLVEDAVTAWLIAVEPEAKALYQRATDRFVQLASEYVARVAMDAGELAGDEDLHAEAASYARRQFHFTSLMHATDGSPQTWLVDHAGPRWFRERDVSRAAVAYLLHLLESNGYRVENDFRERTGESRRSLESAVRARVAEAVGSAERALSVVSARQTIAEREIKNRLERLHSLREELTALTQ